MKKSENGLMEKVVSLCKRRSFVFPGSEIYGGLANSFDYGHLGVELKNNIRQLWWKRFVHQRDDMVGIDAALIMNPKVWEVSGHLREFSDSFVECKKCYLRYRVDYLNLMSGGGKINDSSIEEMGRFRALFVRDPELAIKKYPNAAADSYWKCSACSEENDFNVILPKRFNLMFKTFLGPAEEKTNEVYLRPETAQAMFVDFKSVLGASRKKIPFGIAQIGKSFRNEITPGNFIFRTREFEQMEIEYFVEEKEWQEQFDYWKKEMWSWIVDDLGINKKHAHELEVPDEQRAHYSKRTVDFQYDFPFGREELYGLAYRTDFDLKNHFKEPPYADPDTGDKFYPHVIEPTFGLDRSVLAVLLDAYAQENDRVVLKLKPKLSPHKAAVFPLLANKPELTAKAREVYDMLKKDFVVAWDDRGNIGKRYYSQDEIGTPYCITVDFETLENDDVTVRDRDTMKQERVKVGSLKKYLEEKIYV